MLKRCRYQVLILTQYYAFAIQEIVLLQPFLQLFPGRVRTSLYLIDVNRALE